MKIRLHTTNLSHSGRFLSCDSVKCYRKGVVAINTNEIPVDRLR